MAKTLPRNGSKPPRKKLKEETKPSARRVFRPTYFLFDSPFLLVALSLIRPLALHNSPSLTPNTAT